MPVMAKNGGGRLYYFLYCRHKATPGLSPYITSKRRNWMIRAGAMEGARINSLIL